MFMQLTDWKWHDVPCANKYNFVCKKCVKDCPTNSCPSTVKAPPAPREQQYEYALSKTMRRFNLAEKACVKWGGNLASFQNKEEEEKVGKLIPSTDKYPY